MTTYTLDAAVVDRVIDARDRGGWCSAQSADLVRNDWRNLVAAVQQAKAEGPVRYEYRDGNLHRVKQPPADTVTIERMSLADWEQRYEWRIGTWALAILTDLGLIKPDPSPYEQWLSRNPELVDSPALKAAWDNRDGGEA